MDLEYRLEPAPLEDEGQWHLLAHRAGREVGRAKFDLHEGWAGRPGYVLLLQISVPEDAQRQGIATAMLDHLVGRYGVRIAVEDHTPDGWALFRGHYHWDSTGPAD